MDKDVKAVGYPAANTITNKGNFEWNEKTGVPCIWMLDMFNPSPKTTMPKAIWGFNGAERPGAVYLAATLAAHNQMGLPAFGIYGRDVQDLGG